jgi:transposase
LHLIRLIFDHAKLPITYHPRQPACGRHPSLHAGQIQSQGQNPPDRRMYRERNRIERMIGHLKTNRAIATRYDKLARSFLDSLRIAAIRLRYATL